MTMYSSAWSRPIQGISQQPQKVRLPGQCTTQVNALASAVDGLYTRPGSVYINALGTTYPEGTAFYFYNRGTGEAYFVCIPPNSQPDVYDILGRKLVVEGSHSYAVTSDPVNSLRLSTISDFTFIANSEVVPASSSALTPGRDNTAIISCQFADYGKTYQIMIDGDVRASYQTPDGSQSEHINFVDTTYVAKKLLNQLTGAQPIGDTDPPVSQDVRDEGFGISREGNAIFLSRLADYTLDTEDGRDGDDLIVVQGAVSTVDKLPTRAPEGYLVEVVGSGSGTSEVFWLKAEEISGGAVKWVESVAPGLSVGLDPASMPHALVRDRFEDGKAVFVYQQVEWDERKVGDDDVNPMPSFVQDGVPITSVGTFQNRLYFTAGESVIYSQSNYFFNFFRTTIRTAKDDEPIDVYADTNQVNTLMSSASLDGDLVFFSANGQFLQSGEDPVTKSNATLQYASSFEANTLASPAAAGDAIFFAFDYGRYSGIREFYTDSFTDTKRARPITDHVEELIEGSVRLLATSTSRNHLLVLSDAPNKLYLYSWLWQGQERVQSSWGVWEMDGEIRFVTFDKDRLYILIDREQGTCLERMDMGEPDSNGLTFAARLDAQFEVTATPGVGSWSFDIPYDAEDLVFVQGEGCLDAGVTINYTKDGLTCTTSESLGDGSSPVKVVGGRRFTFLYEPTMPFMKDSQGRVISEDRLIINDVGINYDTTGLTFVKVTNDVGVTREYSFNGRRVGGPSNLVGFAPLRPGTYSFPIRQDSNRATFELRTDSHIPFRLQDMEWRGRYQQRGRRI